LVASSTDSAGKTGAVSGVLVTGDVARGNAGGGDGARDVTVARFAAGVAQVERVAMTTVARATCDVRLARTLTGDVVAPSTGCSSDRVACAVGTSGRHVGSVSSKHTHHAVFSPCP